MFFSAFAVIPSVGHWPEKRACSHRSCSRRSFDLVPQRPHTAPRSTRFIRNRRAAATPIQQGPSPAFSSGRTSEETPFSAPALKNSKPSVPLSYPKRPAFSSLQCDFHTTELPPLHRMAENRDIGSAANDAIATNFSDDVFSGFERLPTYRANEEIPGGSGKGVLSAEGLQAWRHSASGVRVVLFHAPGPLTSANIALGTIPVSEAGHPHTLEHIVFLGSHKYPSRGYLDTLANRSLADGTNAYTDVDHTVYQATAAGFEGLSSLLPCFIDHVLRPKINQKAFASEVYCIRSDGKESGVVFSEMHGRENTEDDLCMCAMNKVLLAGTPLAFNSGGLCGEIRTLTSEGIQRYHDDYYCGSNVTVIVGGSEISPSALLKSVNPMLDDIASSQKYGNKKVSWKNVMELTPMPPVTRKQVKFPCPDDEIGSVLLGWRGPPASNTQDRTANEILMQYLTSTVTAPLRQEFVENENPVASQVYFYIETYISTSAIVLGFSGVSHNEEDPGADMEDGTDDSPSSKEKRENSSSMLTSGEFSKRVVDFLKSLSSATTLQGGLEAMHLMINRAKEGYLSGLEEDSHDLVPSMLLRDVLYSDNSDTAIGSGARGKLASLEQLYEKTEQFWLDLLKTALVEAPRIELTMVPDPDLADKLAEEDSKLTEERIAKMGAEELKRQGEKNEAFIASLASVSFKADDFPRLPSALRIPRIPYSVSLESTSEYWKQSTSVDTDFVHVSILFNTSKLSFSQRLILPLVSRLMFKSDIALDDGSYISYTDSSFAIDEVTVPTDLSGSSLGYGRGVANQCLAKHFAATPEKFSEAVRLTLQALFKAEVSKKRLVTVAKNIMSDITEDYRDAVTMMKAAASVLQCTGNGKEFKSDIFSLPNDVLDSVIGARPLVSLLAEEGRSAKKAERIRQKVVKMVNETLMIIRTLPSSDIFVQITGENAEKWQDEFKDVWSTMRSTTYQIIGKTPSQADARANGSENGHFPVLPISKSIPGAGKRPFVEGTDIAKAIGIPGVENCYIDVRVGANVYSGHEHWASLVVLLEMLCRMEGPLSDAIRGSGLAYDYGIANNHWKGYIRASISETSSPVSAWVAMGDKVFEVRQELSNPDLEPTVLMDLDTAKSITLYGLSCSRSTPEGIVRGAVRDSALGVPSSPSRDRSLSEAVEAVQLTDIVSVFDAYVMPLFQEGSRVAVLTCSPHITIDLTEKFKTCEYPIGFESCSGEDLVPKAILDLVKKL